MIRKANILTFTKAMLTSQVASVVDICVTFVLANVFGLYYVYSTMIGSISGGAFNCYVNYQWTFDSPDCPKISIIIKYAIVWIGNIVLNTYGTYVLTEWITDFSFVDRLASFVSTNIFMIPKIIVAVIVALFWNYTMQRNFVYKRCFFDNMFHLKNK